MHGVRWALLGCTMAIMASPRILAATVEVSVVERGAGPVPDQNVSLYLLTPEVQIDPNFFFHSRPAGRCTTGEAGRCQIVGLPVGVYFAYPLPLADPNLSGAFGPPFAAYGTVTLGKSQASATLRIELQRGVRIQFRVVSNAPVPPRSRVELTSDSGEKAETTFDAGGNARITLGSGRFIARLMGPQAARVVKVELDGAELSTLDVPIELRAPSGDRFITWALSAPCRFRGKVRSDCTPPRVAVAGTLVAPGSWGASALCRAKSCAEPSTTTLNPDDGSYMLELPSGTWQIAPIGASLLESSPPFLEVSCAEGEDKRADFDVREKCEGGSKTELMVRVVGPDEKSIAGARVEVWPSTGNREAKTPIATDTTGPDWNPATFNNLTAGSYLLRARLSGYRTAVTAVDDLEVDPPYARHVTMRLDKGAAIDAIVTDDKNRPVSGVGLLLKRTDVSQADNDPATRLAEPDAEISVAPSKDQTGHVVVTGLSGGGYDVTPVLSGALATASTITIGTGDEAGQSHAIVQLADFETRELSIRVLPAAYFAGRLVCADGGIFPHQIDTCLLGLPVSDEDDAVREACKHPVLPAKSAALSGDRYDEFRVGPLSLGSYRLGLRPLGYTSWTWALGTPDGAQAAVVQVNGPGAIELGTVPALCGPAIELRPNVLSHDPPPDLTLATVEAELTRTSTDGKIERRVVPAEKDRDRVMLRELPEGAWTVKVTMSHPFFMPPAPVHLSAQLKLERGVEVKQSIEIASVGGAVTVEASVGAARLLRPDGVARTEPAKDGAIAIDGVAPDSYRVELCEDPRCARVVRGWDAVRVVRGHTVVLASGP